MISSAFFILTQIAAIIQPHPFVQTSCGRGCLAQVIKSKMANWSWKKVFLYGAAAAIGATLLFANSPLSLPKRVPFNLSQLETAALTYMDGSSRAITARELWKDRGAVLLVVRRAG